VKNIPPRVAIVVDWLTVFGGAESVVKSLLNLFPNAPLFTPVITMEMKQKLKCSAPVHDSFLRYFPSFLKKRHYALLTLLPKAIETLDFSSFDIVISSSSFVAKGVLTKPETLHICYCHSPARYLWEEKDHYTQKHPVGKLFSFFLERKFTQLRMWDRISANRVDSFIANSQYTAKKIHNAWRKKSKVLSPPVDIDVFEKGVSMHKENFFLVVSRLVPQKNIDLIIKTFQKYPHRKVKIVGSGILEKKYKQYVKNINNIEFLGSVHGEELAKLYGIARAVIYPQIEDAGIVPLESLAAGTPVIAFQKGGVLTTLNNNVCIFFQKNTPYSLNKAIKQTEQSFFCRKTLQKHAHQFSRTNFEKKLGDIIGEEWESFSKRTPQRNQVPST
jgi:glycosyltransferase involved in cell wall biosynthesis